MEKYFTINYKFETKCNGIYGEFQGEKNYDIYELANLEINDKIINTISKIIKNHSAVIEFKSGFSPNGKVFSRLINEGTNYSVVTFENDNARGYGDMADFTLSRKNIKLALNSAISAWKNEI